MPVPFSKYSGCGNDFIIIDNRQLKLSLSASAIKKLCHRQQGIGADGLIFLEFPYSTNTSYRMRIFNADGSEAEMCGNGLRCLAQFIREEEIHLTSFWVDAMKQPLHICFKQELIQVFMPPPSASSTKKLGVFQDEVLLHCMDTGVPHAVFFTDDIEHGDFLKFAPLIRFHDAFKPQGVNVNFAKILPDKTIEVRTYERGVEKETLSCGTGSVAVALISAQLKKLEAPIKIRTRSGDHLEIGFREVDERFKDITMTGPAVKVFEGFVDL